MTTIAANGYMGLEKFNADESSVFRASNGTIVATFDPDANTLRHYSVSTDNGATWSASQPLISSASNNDIINLSGIMRGTYWINDTLYLFTLDVGSVPGGTGNVGIRLYILPFSTASNSFTGVTVHDYLTNTLAIGMAVASFWDGTVFHLAASDALYHGVTIFTVALDGTPSVTQFIPIYIGGMPSSMALVVSPAGNATLAYAVPQASNTLFVIAYLYASGTYSAATSAHAEIAVYPITSNSRVHIGLALDALGNVDMIVQEDAAIFALKRTGVNTYSAIQPLYNGAATGVNGSIAFSLVNNASQGELYVFFESDNNDPNGEIFSVVRRGGVWQSVSRVLTGPAQIPDANRVVSNGVIDLIYQIGTNGIGYFSVPASSGPSKPTGLTPSGLISGQAPLFGWTYNNSSVNDPQSAFQLQVFLHGTTTSPVIDTGKVTSAAAQYQALVNLTYDQQYDFRVRVYDTTSGSGSGTVSPWSDIQSFTPVQGPVVVLHSITVSGTTTTASPVSLGSRIFDWSFDYSQPAGHSASNYQLVVYAADGVTVVDATSVVPSPVLPSGTTGYVYTGFIGAHLQNATSYRAAVIATDAVTGVTGRSALWTLNTSWTPPPNVTGLTVTQNQTFGTVTLAWTNPTAAVGIVVLRALAGTGQWETIYNGAVISTLTNRPPLAQTYDYEVITVSAEAIQSTGTTAPNVTVDSPFAIIFTDTVDPSKVVGLRAPNDWDQTIMTLTQDLQSYTPMGRDKPIAFFGMAAFYQAQTVTYWIPAWDDLPDGTHLIGRTVVDNFDAMVRRMNPIQYRDRRGKVFYVTLTNLAQYIDEDIHHKIAFDWSQIDYDGVPL